MVHGLSAAPRDKMKLVHMLRHMHHDTASHGPAEPGHMQGPSSRLSRCVPSFIHVLSACLRERLTLTGPPYLLIGAVLFRASVHGDGA